MQRVQSTGRSGTDAEGESGYIPVLETSRAEEQANKKNLKDSTTNTESEKIPDKK